VLHSLLDEQEDPAGTVFNPVCAHCLQMHCPLAHGVVEVPHDAPSGSKLIPPHEFLSISNESGRERSAV
jgi:hypothetical protein